MKENKEETKLQSEQKTAEEIHPDVAAWNKFKAENKESFRADTVTHDRYLENRLWAAFFAGRDHAASQFKSQLPIIPNPDDLRHALNLIQETIEAMNVGACGSDRLKEAWNTVSDYITKAESQPSPIEGVEREWISVEERLPESNGPVIAYDTDSLTPVKLLCFEDGRFYYEAYGSSLDYTPQISMWMPLPPPPKEWLATRKGSTSGK